MKEIGGGYFLFAFAAGIVSAESVWYVSPQGSADADGSRTKPFAAFEAARDAAREAGGTNRIVALGGEYFLTNTLTLDARDSHLTVEAEKPGSVTLHGGEPITGWKQEGRLWTADLPDVKAGKWDFRSITVNGELRKRACYPGETNVLQNLGEWDKVKLLPSIAGTWERKASDSEWVTMPYKPEDLPATLDIRNAEVRLYHMWAVSLVGVASNDLARHALIFSIRPASPPGAFGRKAYQILNTKEGMTCPGQWYLDRTAGRLVYWPLPGETLAKTRIVAPRVEQILSVSGTQRQRPVRDVTVRGLCLKTATTPMILESFGGTAFAGAVHVAFAKDCRFENLEIASVGGIGFWADACSDITLSGCSIHHTGACGVRLSSEQMFVASNHIHHVGTAYLGSCAVNMHGTCIHLFRNEIHEAPYCGVIAGGYHHLLEENLVYRVMRVMHDGAAFYGNLDTCVIRGNIVRDVVEQGKGFGASAYYLDEQAKNCVVEKNVAIGVPMPTHNHITFNTIVRDNLFITDGDMRVSFQNSSSASFVRNRLYIGGKLKLSNPQGIKKWEGNVILQKMADGDTRKGICDMDNAKPAVVTNAPCDRASAAWAQTAPVLDGTWGEGEWPGRLQGLNRRPDRSDACGTVAYAHSAYDATNLYITARMLAIPIESNNSKITLSRGAEWGKDDGVELSLGTADHSAIFAIRAFPNGAFAVQEDTGLSADALNHLRQGIRCVAKPEITRGKQVRGWIAEFSIPFSSLHIVPKDGLLLPFNLLSYDSRIGEWHCWDGASPKTGALRTAGKLMLEK